MFTVTPKIKVHSYRRARATPVGDSAYVYDWRRSESGTADVCIICMIDGEQRFLKHPEILEASWNFISIKFLCVWLTAKCGLLFADKPHFGCYILSYKCVQIRCLYLRYTGMMPWKFDHPIGTCIITQYVLSEKSGNAECTLVRVI
jgi:hypothetical protein